MLATFKVHYKLYISMTYDQQILSGTFHSNHDRLLKIEAFTSY